MPKINAYILLVLLIGCALWATWQWRMWNTVRGGLAALRSELGLCVSHDRPLLARYKGELDGGPLEICIGLFVALESSSRLLKRSTEITLRFQGSQPARLFISPGSAVDPLLYGDGGMYQYCDIGDELRSRVCVFAESDSAGLAAALFDDAIRNQILGLSSFTGEIAVWGDEVQFHEDRWLKESELRALLPILGAIRARLERA